MRVYNLIFKKKVNKQQAPINKVLKLSNRKKGSITAALRDRGLQKPLILILLSHQILWEIIPISIPSLRKHVSFVTVDVFLTKNSD